MASFRFELARPEDDKQLRDLLARNAMSGEISLSFRREPSYIDVCQLDGGESQTIICRDNCLYDLKDDVRVEHSEQTVE